MRGSDSAPVAQLDRVLGYEPRGRAFESLRARQRNKKYQALRPISDWPFCFPWGGIGDSVFQLAPGGSSPGFDQFFDLSDRVMSRHAPARMPENVCNRFFP